jgi:hypothetical protein
VVVDQHVLDVQLADQRRSGSHHPFDESHDPPVWPAVSGGDEFASASVGRSALPRRASTVGGAAERPHAP